MCEAMREVRQPLTLAGPLTEGAHFWKDVSVERADADWLSEAGVVVLPSWVENQPRRLLAALAAGVPVVCTPACGIEEQPGVTIVPEGNTEALVAALTTHLPQGKPSRSAEGNLATAF